MLWKQIIFSDEKKYRLRRHLLFWGVWFFYFALLHAANPFGKPEISFFRNPIYTVTESFFLVLAQLPLTYVMLYVILPRYILQKKYVISVVSTTLLWLLAGVWHWYLIIQIFPKALSLLLPAQYLENTVRTPGATFFMAVLATYKGAFTVTALALVIKFAKHWYQKEQRNMQLQKEKTEAQMQLLTAQIHPHFLFNTLNNIFSQTQTESPKGSKMIMALSDMLRYILYEGHHPLVPLKQELQMITEYINLEKIRYGNKLDVHTRMPADTHNIYIAPLLLLPFIENCFKHGTSKMLQNPWISFILELHDTRMVMKLMNGKAPKAEAKRASGIGIQNVKQRLELLYKGKYGMQITEDEEVFVVDLQVELTRYSGKTELFLSPQPAEANV